VLPADARRRGSERPAINPLRRAQQARLSLLRGKGGPRHGPASATQPPPGDYPAARGDHCPRYHGQPPALKAGIGTCARPTPGRPPGRNAARGDDPGNDVQKTTLTTNEVSITYGMLQKIKSVQNLEFSAPKRPVLRHHTIKILLHKGGRCRLRWVGPGRVTQSTFRMVAAPGAPARAPSQARRVAGWRLAARHAAFLASDFWLLTPPPASHQFPTTYKAHPKNEKCSDIGQTRVKKGLFEASNEQLLQTYV